jgi:signal transduction histidine kinase
VEEELDLAPELATALFRILQETLTNVARHAQATSVTVTLVHTPEQVEMTVADNGIGVDVRQLENLQSFGIIGMRERLYPWRGRLDIESVPHRGTRVRITVPLHPPLKEEYDD